MCIFSVNSYKENGAPLTLTPQKFALLKSLSKNKNLIIQKLNKANSVAIIDKNGYLEKMQNIFTDSSEFSQVSVTEDKQVNFIVNVGKHVTNLLKDLKMSEVIS